jgi:hypothetical protein
MGAAMAAGQIQADAPAWWEQRLPLSHLTRFARPGSLAAEYLPPQRAASV